MIKHYCDFCGKEITYDERNRSTNIILYLSGWNGEIAPCPSRISKLACPVCSKNFGIVRTKWDTFLPPEPETKLGNIIKEIIVGEVASQRDD
jgi:hypothetical protein